MLKKVSTWRLVLITAAMVSSVFMMPLLLGMEYLGLSPVPWLVFLLIFLALIWVIPKLDRPMNRVSYA